MPSAKAIIFELVANDRASAVFERVGKAAESSAVAVEGAHAKQSTAMAGLAAGATKLGLGIAAAGALAGAASVKMAGDFQKQMTLLVTGAGEAQSNIKAVSSGILAMAGSTGTSASELAKGMYLIESAGYHASDGLKVLRAAAEGAKADGADLDVVGDALTTTLHDLHAPASQAADVMSKMVAAVGSGKMRMDDFAGSIHNVLPNAAAIGLSFGQVAGALATMTAQGISADQASQNLNHAIIHLTSPTLAQSKALAQYGLSATDVAKNLGKRGLTGTLELLEQAVLQHMGPAGLTLTKSFNQSKEAAHDAQRELDNLPPAAQRIAKAYANGSLSLGDYKKQIKDLPADQANLVQQWKATEDASKGFNQALRSGRPDAQTFAGALRDLMGDSTGLQVALHLTGENMATFKDNVAKITGTTAEAGGHVKDWGEIQHNFNQQIDKAKESLDAFMISVGTKLLPGVSAAIGDLSSLTGWFARHSTVAASAAVAVAAFAAAVVTATVVTKAYAAAVFLATAAGEAWAAVTAGVETAAIAALYAQEILASIATKGLAAAQAALDIVMDANPIGLVVLAIAALVAGIVVAYKESATFRGIVNGTWSVLRTVVVASAHAIATGVEAAWHAISSVVSSVNHAYQSSTTGTWSAIRGVVTAGVRAVVAAIAGLATIAGRIAGYWQAAVNAQNKAIGLLVSAAKALGGKILSAVGNLSHLLVSVGSDIIGGLVSGIESGIGRVTAAASRIANAIPGPIKKILGIASPSRLMIGYGGFIVQGLVLGMDGATGLAVASATRVAKATTNAYVSGLSAVKSLGKYLSGSFQGAAGGKSDTPQTSADQAGATLTQNVAAAFQGAVDARAKLLDQIKAQNTKVAGYSAEIIKKQRELGDALTSKGKDAGTTAANLRDDLAALEKKRTAAEGLVKSLQGNLAALDRTVNLSSKIKASVGTVIANGVKKMNALIGQDTVLKSQIDAAKSALDQATQAKASYASGIENSLDGSAGLSSALGAVGDDASFGSIADWLQGQLTAMRTYQADLATLRGAGFDQDLINQIVGMPMADAERAAHALAAEVGQPGDSAAIMGINAINGQIRGISAGIAGSQASTLYDGQINNLSGALSGLELQEKRTADALTTLADNTAVAVARELKKAGIRVAVSV